MSEDVVKVEGYINKDLLPLAEAININADAIIELQKEVEKLKKTIKGAE